MNQRLKVEGCKLQVGSVGRVRLKLPLNLFPHLQGRRLNCFAWLRISIQSGRGQPHSKTSRSFGEALQYGRFWSAAVLCRFGFSSDLTGSFSRTRAGLTDLWQSTCNLQP